VQRLRGRFRGRTSPFVLAALGLALLLLALTFRSGTSLGQGLYRIGVSPDGPVLDDRRFVPVAVDPADVQALLASHRIDAYVDARQVIAGSDAKSQYALGALKRYLEGHELARISEQYDLARAFPLRVEVNYLTQTVSSSTAIRPGELADLLASTPPPEAGETPPDNSEPGQAASSLNSDAAVREQLQSIDNGAGPQIELNPAADKEIVIPSLLTPPLPFAQVLIAFIYIVPMSLVSVFFVSSFMDEKINRRLTILMSAPVTPLHIILGKMLPYATFSVMAVIVLALISQVDVSLALAIFVPVILFIFAIYLMVPMLYRTFKDTTFISMLATALTTAYLIFPAAFSGVNDLAYISPLTLAVKMYRGETFGVREYLFAVVPMAALFGLSLYTATRVLNEEYLLGYKSLSRKLADAVFLVLNRRRPYLSIFWLSLLLIPLVYMLQLALLAMSTNLPSPIAVEIMLLAAAVIEELAKSIGIVMLIERHIVRSVRQIVALSLLSAGGFLIGEKLLLLISVSVVSESALSAVLFDTGVVIVPLIAHFVCTAIVCLLRGRLHVRFAYAVLAGAVVHAVYNFLVAGGLR
jgi:ABC-type Na+ efflux pump permease subunit